MEAGIVVPLLHRRLCLKPLIPMDLTITTLRRFDNNYIAGLTGLEPVTKVLETSILPLN